MSVSLVWYGFIQLLPSSSVKFSAKKKNSYPLISKNSCAYQGVRNVSFLKSFTNEEQRNWIKLYQVNVTLIYAIQISWLISIWVQHWLDIWINAGTFRILNLLSPEVIIQWSYCFGVDEKYIKWAMFWFAITKTMI